MATATGTATSDIPGRGAARRVPGPLVLVGGLTSGLLWGVNARLWMRFISTDPEFSWSGTLFIVIGFGIAGLAQSGAYLGRRAELRRPAMTVLRVVTGAGLLPLGMAAGGPMLPTIMLAPLALTHHDWPRPARGLVGLVSLLPFGYIATSLGDLAWPRQIAGFVWAVTIYAGIVWAARFSLRPQLDGWRLAGAARLVVVVPVALVFVVLFGAMAGI